MSAGDRGVPLPLPHQKELTNIPMTSDHSWEKLSDKAAPSAWGSAAPLSWSPSIVFGCVGRSVTQMCRKVQRHGRKGREVVGGGR